VLVPVLIFFGGMSVGAVSGARWLPDLAVGLVGGLAFFAVCGLLGAAVGLVGIHIYGIVEELDRIGGSLGGVDRGGIVAQGLRNILFEAGSLFAFASIIYLLAPPPAEDEPEVLPAA
jgi:hypothetical protein